MQLLTLLFALVATFLVVLAIVFDIIEPGQRWRRTGGRAARAALSPGEGFDNLFWFVQISDIHLSIFRDLQRGPDLIRYCHKQLKVVQPHLVIISGDLVDAKTENSWGSKQYEEEWRQYEKIVEECTQDKKWVWLDVRGNHDAFDVPDLSSPSNFYRHYSVRRGQNHSHYVFNFGTNFGTYSFIGMDACPTPGPRRPFNFFGQLGKKDLETLAGYAWKTRNSNLTFWFGHYPLSTIVHDSLDIMTLFGGSIAYLCGHLHTLGGFVTNMYTRHKTGMLELELGDWKDNRIYRILAVDHDMLSFTDMAFGEWPVILITNPKHALFLTPGVEPTSRIAISTHIRLLLFTPGIVKYVQVSLDGIFVGEAIHIKGPLYVFPWKPTNFSTGQHTIRVVVEDSLGHKKDTAQPFSVDGSQPTFAVIPRLVLMMSLTVVFKVIFWVLSLFHILGLVILHGCSNIRPYFLTGEQPVVKYVVFFLNIWMKRLWMLSQSKKLYYPLLVLCVYTAIGPWFVGEFLENEIGVMFVWGVYVKRKLLQANFTYFYGIAQLLTFNIPLMLYLAYFLDRITIACHYSRELPLRKFWLVRMEIPFVLMFVWQLYIAMTGFASAYGTKAFLLCPVRTWASFLVISLNYQAYILGKEATVQHSGSSS